MQSSVGLPAVHSLCSATTAQWRWCSRTHTFMLCTQENKRERVNKANRNIFLFLMCFSHLNSVQRSININRVDNTYNDALKVGIYSTLTTDNTTQAGVVLYVSYFQQIPLKDQNQQFIHMTNMYYLQPKPDIGPPLMSKNK